MGIVVTLNSLKIFSQSNDVVKSILDCKGLPEYFNQTKFLVNRPFGFSVAEKNTIGLAFVQFPTNENPRRIFRFPSWDTAGYLGAVVTDKQGNSYVTPRPFINTLNNEPAKQNTIYKVNSDNGEMYPFIELTKGCQQNFNTNPYGLMGITYDCETNILYASSIFGSEIDNECGSIYAIKLVNEGRVIDTISGIDAIGIGIVYINGKKKLFYGKARTSDIYEIGLNSNGTFLGQSRWGLSILGLGIRGDDKARKIYFDTKGDLLISGINFNFNLANQDSVIEYIYRFRYNQLVAHWEFVNIEKGQL
ncbi:MAG TPA: hypothetical protein VGB95_02765 [Chitinophagales bacterium]